MTTCDNQSETIADPNKRCVDTVERIDTHSAIVFLAGDHVLKLKRAVKFPFLDFSSIENRGECFRREVALNRLTAPTL